MIRQGKKNYFWDSIKNLIGTLVYYFCQWLMTIIIVHITDYTIFGEFSLVIAFTNLFGFLSLYNIRSLQLSDIDHGYSPQQYSGAYLVTSGLALILFILALPFSGYNFNLILCCMVYMIYKLCETFSIYIYTYMQLENRFANIAVSFSLKGIVPLIGFTICLYFKQGLFLPLCVMTLLFLAIIVVYDFPNILEYFPRNIKIKGIRHILRQCFPLMMSTLIVPFMFFLIRHTVEEVYGTTELGYYSAFTMIIVVMSVMTGAVYVVILPMIAEKYKNNQKRNITFIIFIVFGIIFTATLIAIVLAHLIGDWVFSFIFDFTILPYMYLLVPVIISGSMLAIMTFLSTCLIAMNKRISMLFSMLAGVFFLCVFVLPITISYGLLGAINILTYSLILTIIVQVFVIIYYLASKKNIMTI